MSKNFIIENTGDVVAWAILGRLEYDEVCQSVQAIQEAVSRAKRVNGNLKIIVDNYAMSREGATAFTPQVAEKWGELQNWFVNNLSDGDKIGVIQGRVTMMMQMTRLGQQIGLDKIEKHFCEKSYADTKQKAYEYVGVTSNRLIDEAEKLALA